MADEDDTRIKVESNGRQFAANGYPLVSSADALGVSQILQSTAEDVAKSQGFKLDLDRLYTDPGYNKMLGDIYAKQLRQKFGDGPVALAAYNAGPGNPGVLHYAKTGDPSQLPAETKDYLRKNGYMVSGESGSDPTGPMTSQVLQGGAQLQQDSKAYQAKQAALGEQLQKTMRDHPAPPDYPIPEKPPEAPKHSSFLDEFGSVASTLAIFGSLLSRHPLTTALTASAAAMNAIQNRETETFKEKMSVWKANAEYAGQVQAALDRKYAAIMDAHKGDVSAILAEMKATASAFGDEVTMHHLETGDLNVVENHLRNMQMMNMRFQAATQKVSTAADQTYEFITRVTDPGYRDKVVELVNKFKETYGRAPTKAEAINIMVENKIPPKQKSSDTSGQGAQDIVDTLKSGGTAKIGPYTLTKTDLDAVNTAQILGQSALSPAQQELKRRMSANAKSAQPELQSAAKSKSGEAVLPLPDKKDDLKVGGLYSISKEKIPSGIGKWDGTHFVPAE